MKRWLTERIVVSCTEEWNEDVPQRQLKPSARQVGGYNNIYITDTNNNHFFCECFVDSAGAKAHKNANVAVRLAERSVR